MDKLVEKNNKGAHNLVYPFDTLPQPGRMLKIDNGVYWVRMSLPFALNHINLWVLKDDNGWVVVDTGVASADIKSNWRKCFSGDMNGESVNKIIVTHLHPDHIGLAGWMNKKFSAPLYMSRSDYLMCRMLVSDTGREAPEEGKSLYRSAGFTEDELDAYSERFGGFGSAISRLPDSYNRLKDYDVINIGGYDWEVVVGSGHCPEHICLYNKKLKLFISGDQVLPKITSNVSVFPTEPNSNPLNDWIESCKYIKSRVNNDVLVLPSHNEPFRGLHERLDHLINGHERNLTRLLEFCEEPKRAVDVFSVLFKRKITSDVLLMATGESIAHLNCLIHRGLLGSKHDDEGIIRYYKL